MCQFGPVKMQGGPKRGNSWKNQPPPPSPLKIGSGKLVLDKKFPPDKLNAMEWSKRMYEEVSLLSVPFQSKHFDAFWHFMSFWVIIHVYYGYNKFDWLTLVLRSNWTCRIWFGILSSRAFCIVVSDFAYLLPFSNNFPLKLLKNIHSGFTLVHIPNNSACSIYAGLWLKLL